MSKITLCILPSLLIAAFAVFAFLSPSLLPQKSSGNAEALGELVNQRLLSIGNMVAHASFVTDALLEENYGNLSEIVTQVQKDEKEITLIHFLSGTNRVIASSDVNAVGKQFTAEVLGTEPSTVRAKAGTYEGGFNITLGTKKIGAFYIKAVPKVPVVKVASAPNPIVLVAGIVLAIISFAVTMVLSRGIEAKLVDDINKRQEEVFQPKIEALKSEQASAQKTLDELNKNIAASQQNLKAIEAEFNARKKEIEAHPVVQSIEKLKAGESELLKRLEMLKEEQGKLQKEIALSKQQREEILSALDAEKKEETALRERLDLIKKKILHLETPGK